MGGGALPRGRASTAFHVKHRAHVKQLSHVEHRGRVTPIYVTRTVRSDPERDWDYGLREFEPHRCPPLGVT